ncbi:MAG: hypothetical protein F4Z14_09045 [Gammaproteobacteria bacterium]|nr:hypothetical protein [Gammaproteobacteria bacterium]
MVRLITLILTGLSICGLLAIKEYFSVSKLSYVFMGMGVVTGVSAVLFDSSMFLPTIAFGLMANFEGQAETEAIENGTNIYIKEPTLPLFAVILAFFLTSGTRWWSLSNPWDVFALIVVVAFHLFLLIGAIIFLLQKTESKNATEYDLSN